MSTLRAPLASSSFRSSSAELLRQAEHGSLLSLLRRLRSWIAPLALLAVVGFLQQTALCTLEDIAANESRQALADVCAPGAFPPALSVASRPAVYAMSASRAQETADCCCTNALLLDHASPLTLQVLPIDFGAPFTILPPAATPIAPAFGM